MTSTTDHTTGITTGTVNALWRYPVKSMAGEQLDASEVTGRGLLGDRAYALVDAADGKVATAKNPRTWPTLFAFAAALADPPHPDASLPAVRITLPDGGTVTSGQPDADELLSAVLGRPVRLQAAAAGGRTSEEYWPDIEGLDARDTVTDFDLPEGMFFDCAVVHLVTTSTLEHLHELYPQGEMAVRRFRPNVVVGTAGGPAFVENDWVGRTLHLGEQVQLQVDGPCPRCVMVTLPQGDLPKDLGILRTAAQHNGANVGIYASVVRGGRVQAGDVLTVR